MPKPKMTKAEFVRSHSALKPQAILKRAKAAGVSLTLGYIYNVRGAANAKAKKATPAARGRPAAAKSGGLRQAIERMVQEFAERILAQLRTASLTDLLGK